jgi:hypothetical protein
MGVLGQTKNKYISMVFYGCLFGGPVCRRDNKQNTTNRSPASDQSLVFFCAYVLFTTIRENSQMVPVCIILAALLVPVQSRRDNATGSPALSHSFIRLQQRMKQQQQYSFESIELYKQTYVVSSIHTHTHRYLLHMCVCIELLRNTASTQLIRHKKFTFASKEFVLNFVGMQLERPLSLMSFYCHILFSFCFCSRSSSSLFLSFSPVYICLSPSHAFFFSWKETKRNSQVEHAERVRGEGVRGAHWEKIQPTRARFKSAQTVEKPQKNLKSDIIS